MSTQLQQPQPQQPVVVYPNNVPAGQAPPSHSHSHGSFGPVFIVLAVIIVISVIACFIGRMCNRRGNQTKPPEQNRNHDFRPKERDVEFGLGSGGRIPGAEPPSGHGEPSKGFKMPGSEDVGGPRMPEQGDPIPRIRIPGNGDPRGRRVHANGDTREFRIVGPKPEDDGPLKPDA